MRASMEPALDIKRKASGLDWAGIATESGVSASTICRIRTGKNPDANSLAKLVSWCGMDLNHLNVLKGVRSRFCVFGS
jgi:hypothetical protein